MEGSNLSQTVTRDKQHEQGTKPKDFLKKEARKAAKQAQQLANKVDEYHQHLTKSVEEAKKTTAEKLKPHQTNVRMVQNSMISYATVGGLEVC
eukprot:3325926-Amphidinium_carterae.1